MSSTPRYSGRRRSSMPTLSLSNGAVSSLTAMHKNACDKLDNISDEDGALTENGVKGQKSSSVEDLPPLNDTPKRGTTSATSGGRRRHSIVTMCSSSPKKSVVKSTNSGDIIVRTPRRGSITSISELDTKRLSASLSTAEPAPSGPRGRRHSVACVGASKELHSILKKNKAGEEEDHMNGDSDASKLAWTEQPRPPTASMDFDRDMPGGSDIFKLVMGEFLPEEEEEMAQKIATVKLKDCDDDDSGNSNEEAETEEAVPAPNVRRIRWNEHVDVIR